MKKEVANKRGFLIASMFLMFIFISVFARAEITAQALDTVIKENNEDLKKAMTNIISEQTKEIITSVLGTDFKDYMSQKVKDVFVEERIKTMIGSFLAILLALLIYSLIRFKLDIRRENLRKVNKKYAEQTTPYVDLSVSHRTTPEQLKIKEEFAKEISKREVIPRPNMLDESKIKQESFEELDDKPISPEMIKAQLENNATVKYQEQLEKQKLTLGKGVETY